MLPPLLPAALRPCSGHAPSTLAQVLLEGGDLLLLCGPARYQWRHGISSVAEEVYRHDAHAWVHAALCVRKAQEAEGAGADASVSSSSLPAGCGAMGAGLPMERRVVRSRRVSITLRRLCSGVVLDTAAPA